MHSRVLLVGDTTDRLLAVARRLPEPVLVTGAVPLPGTDLLTEHLPEVPRGRRDRFLRDRLRHLVELHEARVVVLDGVPEDGFLAATADHPELAWVWLRPAMWRRDTGIRWRGREAAFDLVLEPGEFAGAGDEGWTVQDRAGVTTVAPITMLDPADLLDRAAARELLGLGPAPTVVLRGVAADVPGFVPITPEPHALRAADLAVATADYTSFHELLSAGVPTVFTPALPALPAVPSVADDQLARARFAAAAGVALCAEPGADLGDLLAEAARPEVRAALAARCAQTGFGNGAGEVAAWVTKLAAR